ncbi:MAG: DUF3991 domain-containing protein, partial [Acetobacteraceae bacterium]
MRQVLRPFVGLVPTSPEALREKKHAAPDWPLPERWDARPRLRHGSPGWRYLSEQRCLPAHVLAAADDADIVREGPYGSAWFAHRDDAGVVSHIEIRGPDFKGSVRGGSKTLFRLAGRPHPTRLAVTEAPIDALSLAALEGIRANTAYAATGGGMGPGTIAAIERALAATASFPDALLVSATDANTASNRYASRHTKLAAAAGVAFERLRPTIGTDWNDVLREGGDHDLRSRMDLAALRPAAGPALARSVGLDRRRSGNRPVAHLSLGRLFGLGSAALRGPAQPHRAGAVPDLAGPPLHPDEALRELLHDSVEALMGGWDPITPLKPH